MWREIGRKFLELYEIQDCEDNINLARFSMLDAIPRKIEKFHVCIVYKGENARSEIRPEISDSKLFLVVDIKKNANLIQNKHFIGELVPLVQDSSVDKPNLAESEEFEVPYDKLHGDILSFNKENLINSLLKQGEFDKLKCYLDNGLIK